MLKMLKDPYGEALNRYAQCVSDVRSNKANANEMHEQLYHLTALLVFDEDESKRCSKSVRRQLLRKISWAPIEVFQESVVETVIQCWQWISSARRDLEALLMLEMVAAWQATIDNRLGLFRCGI